MQELSYICLFSSSNIPYSPLSQRRQEGLMLPRDLSDLSASTDDHYTDSSWTSLRYVHCQHTAALHGLGNLLSCFVTFELNCVTLYKPRCHEFWGIGNSSSLWMGERALQGESSLAPVTCSTLRSSLKEMQLLPLVCLLGYHFPLCQLLHFSAVPRNTNK